MIELEHLSKVFDASSKNIKAVNDVSLKIEKGDVYGIIGLSGAGKSTLVRCINFLEKPTGGKVVFDGIDLGTLPHKELLKQRQKMSMIFQNFNLLSQRTALKNVCYPLEIIGTPKKEAQEKAKKLLDTVGLSDRMYSYPAQLSGGQKQRVAIARALATDPQVLLCDEATSALDPNTTRAILSLLKKINTEMGVTIIVITHEMKVVEQICNKVAVIENGKIVEQGYVKDIFMSPSSDIAKELILPKYENANKTLSQRILRIAFDGRSSVEPLIANLILECRVVVNIMGADMKDINGVAYGQMLLQLPEDDTAVNRIKAYLDKKDVKYEEV